MLSIFRISPAPYTPNLTRLRVDIGKSDWFIAGPSGCCCSRSSQADAYLSTERPGMW